ncbi:MAG: hypothetical protein IJE84_03615 [Clostridia bacterium]|nr:hypothetical protein [Clostridia bacterium]
MIDWHTHILPGMDDGSTDTAESVRMLERLSSEGVGTVIATSHFYANETWTVADKFAITITSVTRHYMCDSYYNDLNTKNAVIINYEVKNLGISTKLKVDKRCFEVYDESGDQGEEIYFEIYCDHGKDAGNVLVGGKGTASLPVAMVNNGNSVTILMEVQDATYSEKYTAQFKIPVSEASAEPAEPEDDKLDGCTIKLDATLPTTYHYYSYSGKISSSCQVTDVSFEVSGDDLNIYFTGKKTYDSQGSGQSSSCMISWKLYDSNNNVVADGTCYTLSLATGEGFVKAKDTAYNCIQPGGTYTLKLLNTN